MFAGVPSAYATFVGYDEVAHHSGVESEDAFDILHKLDQQFARLESAAQQAPRPYHFVVLSDHGQSAGATFKQRYHMTLEDLVQQLAEEYRVEGRRRCARGLEACQRLSDRSHPEREQGGEPSPGPGPEGPHRGWPGGAGAGRRGSQGDAEETEARRTSAQIVVLASGNLGLVYSTRLDDAGDAGGDRGAISRPAGRPGGSTRASAF